MKKRLYVINLIILSAMTLSSCFIYNIRDRIFPAPAVVEPDGWVTVESDGEKPDWVSTDWSEENNSGEDGILLVSTGIAPDLDSASLSSESFISRNTLDGFKAYALSLFETSTEGLIDENPETFFENFLDELNLWAVDGISVKSYWELGYYEEDPSGNTDKDNLSYRYYTGAFYSLDTLQTAIKSAWSAVSGSYSDELVEQVVTDNPFLAE